MGKMTFALCAIICLFRPCEAQAREVTDPVSAPRVGVEIQNYWAGSTYWQEGFRGGFDTNLNLGLGILEDHGGAMMRAGFGGTRERFLGGEEVGRRLNLEALVWMPWSVGWKADCYLAFGPTMQYAESSQNQTWNPGAVTELGWDWKLLSWMSLRYALKARLFPSGSFDAGFVFGSAFISSPL